MRHVRRLVAERRIPFLKWGNLLRFDPHEIAAWLDDKLIAPPHN
jgi:excisionase family DNA binding protein